MSRLRNHEWFGPIRLLCIFLLVIDVVAGPLATNASAAEHRAVNIWSDGTRMSGDLWLPLGHGDGTKPCRSCRRTAGPCR